MGMTLGMGALKFAPRAVFRWIMPVVCAIMAYMGLTVADSNGVRLDKSIRRYKSSDRKGSIE